MTKSKFTIRKRRPFQLVFFAMACLILGTLNPLSADEIDIGLFESITPANQLEVRLMPDYQINGEAITNIVYTVRWQDPSIVLTTNYIFPYLVFPSGPPVLDNGWYYQIFVAVPLTAYVNWSPGNEYVVSTFTHNSSGCAPFEIIENDWTDQNNGDYYISVSGLNRTGIIYEPAVYCATDWTGNIDDDWFDDGNWTYGVPNQLMNTTVPAVDPNPYPHIHGDAYCNDMQIDPMASVTVGYDGFLTSLGAFNSEGDFTVKSTPSGTGSFIDNGTITGNGTNTVERFVSNGMWHFISPPISDGLSGIFLNIFLYEWSEPDSAWSYIVPTTIPLNAMQGYMTWADSDSLTGDTTTYFTGTLNTGYHDMNLTNVGVDPEEDGWNFVGNPYPSAINWESDNGWTWQNIENSVYIFNDTIGVYGSYTKGDPNSGTNSVDSIIPATSAFFVKVSDGFSSGLIGVDNAARVHYDKDIYKSTSATIEHQFIHLSTSNPANGYGDEIKIQFKSGATPDYDGQFDAYKLTGRHEAPQLFSMSADNIKLALNSWEISDENLSIPVGFTSGLPGMFTIKFEQVLNFDQETEVLFTDLQEDITVNMKEQHSYSFMSTPIDDPQRFVINFIYDPESVTEFEDDTQLQIYAYNKLLHVKTFNSIELPMDLQIFDLPGRMVKQQKLTKSVNAVPVNNLHGIYIVTVTSGNKIVSTKVNIE